MYNNPFNRSYRKISSKIFHQHICTGWLRKCFVGQTIGHDRYRPTFQMDIDSDKNILSFKTKPVLVLA
jgi:hypothetical protein